MGKKGNKAGEELKISPPTTRGGAWVTAKQKRKYRRWLLWLLGPLMAAAAIALLGAPAAAPGGDRVATSQAPAPDAGIDVGGSEAPPMDTHEKPEECLAWAGDGQCVKNPGFMLEKCAFSCAKIEYAKQRYYKRCPKPDN